MCTQLEKMAPARFAHAPPEVGLVPPAGLAGEGDPGGLGTARPGRMGSPEGGGLEPLSVLNTEGGVGRWPN